MAAASPAEYGSDLEDDEILAAFGFSDSESDDYEFEGFSPEDLPENAAINATFAMPQSQSSRENPEDVLFGWSDEDSSPILAPFTGTPGWKGDLPDPSERSELFFFNLLFDADMWDTIRDAEQQITKKSPLPPHSRYLKWSAVTVDELKVFFALCLNMGLVKKPDIADYWTNDETHATPFFGKFMCRDRFLMILSNLHFVDNTERHGSDRLYKLRPFINMLRNNFHNYQPRENLSIDEGTCPFKGKVVFRVYNPAKPNKFGIKLYQICESESGYIVSFDIYDGTPGCAMYSELVGVNQNAGQTTKLVVGLLARSGLLDKGHKVYLDNYYTSPELAEELDTHDTYMCGTVRVNRRNMPKIFPTLKLRAGETAFRRKNNILAIKFHEKRDVHMISSIHEATNTILTRRRHGGDVVKPTAVVDYCKYMGGVDLSDQLIQYYEGLRRTVKWYKKLFFHLLNMLVINAYKLFLKYGPTRKCRRTHQHFRSKLVLSLIKSAEMAPRPTGSFGCATLEPVDRLRGSHLPVFCPAKPGAKRKHPQRDCVACNLPASQREGKKRAQTIFMCKTCNVALCMPECFRIYHTHKHYKKRLQKDRQACDSSSSTDSNDSDTN